MYSQKPVKLINFSQCLQLGKVHLDNFFLPIKIRDQHKTFRMTAINSDRPKPDCVKEMR